LKRQFLANGGLREKRVEGGPQMTLIQRIDADQEGQKSKSFS
jgi:hypothetical protein